MKSVRIAAFAAFVTLAAPVALAQQAAPAAVPASSCPAVPASPTLPDGATAPNSRAIREADATYQAWGLAAKAALDCRAAEVEELTAAARRYQARVNEYNADAERVRAVAASWTAEVAEYNARTTGGPQTEVQQPDRPWMRASDRNNQ